MAHCAYGTAGKSCETDPGYRTDAPTTKTEMLHYLSTQFPGQAVVGADEIFSEAEDLLSDGWMTGAQRAAVYDVLASLPEITEDPDVTTLTGKNGVAIGHASSDGLSREDLIFDPTTHKLIGTRTVNLGQRGTQPPGSVEEQSAVLQAAIVPTLAVRPDGTRLPIMPTGSKAAHR